MNHTELLYNISQKLTPEAYQRVINFVRALMRREQDGP